LIGSKPRMPKRARYPLFLLGLAVILIGGIAANATGSTPSTLAAVVASGFALLVLAVIFK
jgi:hypothetical protein